MSSSEHRHYTLSTSRAYVVRGCWGLLVSVVIALAGCGSPASSEVAIFHCRVQIEGVPAGDVCVSLVSKPTPGTLLKLEGITDGSGLAAMTQVSGVPISTGTELSFRAGLESLGDWTIRKPWSDADRSPVKVDWDGQAVVDIELPRKAVRSL